jgi:hypothetical protein
MGPVTGYNGPIGPGIIRITRGKVAEAYVAGLKGAAAAGGGWNLRGGDLPVTAEVVVLNKDGKPSKLTVEAATEAKAVEAVREVLKTYQPPLPQADIDIPGVAVQAYITECPADLPDDGRISDPVVYGEDGEYFIAYRKIKDGSCFKAISKDQEETITLLKSVAAGGGNSNPWLSRLLAGY